MLGNGNDILCAGLFEQLHPIVRIESLGAKLRDEVLVALPGVEGPEPLGEVLVRGVAGTVHVVRIPLVHRARNGIHTPADEDAELRIPEPLRNLVIAQRLPVRPVRTVVRLAIRLLQQSLAPRIVL